MTGSGISSKEQHAILGPSGAERWTTCPASVRMSLEVPPAPESPYAEEGTCFHALCEIEARKALGQATSTQYVKDMNRWRKKWAHILVGDVEGEMQGYAQDYVALILGLIEDHPEAVVLLEQRVHTGIPQCWGTGDCIIILAHRIYIIDAKYGAGVFVTVEGNPQLRLYGVGALEELDVLGEIDEVVTMVFQPRMDNVASEVIEVDTLREWRDGLIPIAEVALGEDAPFNPSEEACRWCPASGQCRAQLEWATALDFGTDPDMLSPEDLSGALERIPAMIKWAEDVRALSLDRVYSRKEPIPGWKVVLSGGRRVITDVTAAVDALLADGHPMDDIYKPRAIQGVTHFDKLLGKTRFQEVLGPFVTKTEGSPSLVSEADKRPAIDADGEAAKEFEV